MTPKLANKALSEKSTQIMGLERHKEPYNTANWTRKRGMYIAASVITDRQIDRQTDTQNDYRNPRACAEG